MRLQSTALIYALIYLICLLREGQCFWPFSKKPKPGPTKPSLSPVIFVPGDGGSQMDARLNKSQVPHFLCQKTADWFNLWLNLEELMIPLVYCWVDNIKLYYDAATRTTHNTPGVEIKIPGWGNPEVVEWIDPTHNKAGAYFKDIANLLVDLGYIRKANIHGAPYDFRKAPNENQQFFIDLKQLVEDTYEANNRTAVTFISHSMGSPMTLVFLQQQTLEWKRKYVRRLISLAGAWAGSMKAVKVFAMGDDLDSIVLSTKILRVEQITNPSSAWLLPSPLFWKSSEVLVETPSHNYTMASLEKFFEAIDYKTGWEMRKDTLRYTENFSPPDVELHCLYGDGVDTVEKLQYKKDDIAGETPKLIMGVGDGTVNQRSLRACRYWTGVSNAPINALAVQGVDHMGILSSSVVLDYIENIMKQP
ncbi:group XV phospholipase A2-like [Scaptodrosophila lebanonensis]|uniref:Group XV phospholipase A2-like n=1 Tax=Drosophila lebanonensis TaxID=7225 RepID=A0A6J2UAD0_DROLE|nr:group XV phospholipase A2-like [Scaptodrosophila lebanonensis]